MSSKTNVKIGSPVDTLPDPERVSNEGNAAPHWVAAARACQERAGMWVPITIPSLSVSRHTQCPKEIRSAKLLAFRNPNGGTYDAAYRNRQLYIRYLPAGTVVIGHNKKTA